MFRRLPRIRWHATTLAALLLPPAAEAQGLLEVVNPRGEVSTLTGVTVLSETLDEVRFRRAGSDRSESRKSDLVVRVEYGPGSASFEQARERAAAGDLSNAANLFAVAAGEAEPPWGAPRALLELARTEARRGSERRAKALAAVDEFLTRFPDHRLLPEAQLLRAEQAAASGDLAAAAAAVQQVAALAGTGRISADWSVRSSLAHGQMLLAADKAREAGDAFAAADRAATDALRAVGERADLKARIEAYARQARVGLGQALIARGDVGAAREYFRKLASDASGDPGTLAASRNGQAECDLREEKLKEAQLGFARVAVAAAGIPEEHAKALYYLGRCAEALAQAGQERTGRQRARDYFAEVVWRYPDSTWARAVGPANP